MAKHSKPRAGSLAYKPMKKAKKETPRIRSWASSDEVGFLGFAGYKAGMTNVLAVDNRKNSPTSGMEIFIPVTVIETPPMRVLAIRAYRKGYLGEETVFDVWADELPEDISRRTSISAKKGSGKKLKTLEGMLEGLSDIRLVVATQPKSTSMPKKTPDIMEIALGGSVQEGFDFSKELLGKEVNAADVLTDNTFVDVASVTKGKGFQGVVKRYGVRIQPRKAGRGTRHIGSGGAWTPTRKMWREPLPGQMGYNTRTEYNKPLLKVGSDGSEVSPKGGFLRYGPVNNGYLLIAGSVPGPSKRLIRINKPKRAKGEVSFEITHVNRESKQGV